MKRGAMTAALLAGAMLVLPSPLLAQDGAALLAEIKAMREKIAALESKVSQLEAIRAQPAALPSATASPSDTAAPTASSRPAAPPTEVAWPGGPQFRQAESGFSFRPRGFIQFDAGTIENPGEAISSPNFGFNARARRIVFGAEGGLPGGFGYKAEFNLAGGVLDYEDVILTYSPPGLPVQLTVGNFFPLAGLEATTSSRLGSVLEREQATDAFGFGRRLGAAIQLVDPADRYGLAAGLFSTPIGSGFNNDSWQASVRGYFAPTLGQASRLHVGASFQHRVPQSDAQNVRFRARPFTQLTDYRFVDTGPIAAKSDAIVGLELAAMFGPLHIAAEGHRLWVNGHRAGTNFGPLEGVGSGLYYDNDPVFGSAYAEIGYYLTGETRGYRGGRWNNVKVLRPFGKGGWGAFQVNARIDHLDLSDRVVLSGTALSDHINGGRQTGYQLSAIWNPIDQVRLLLHYAHIDIVGGPSAALAVPDAAADVDARAYGFDSIALRTQVEF